MRYDDLKAWLAAEFPPGTELLADAPVLWSGKPSDHHAVLVRLPDGTPRLVFVDGAARPELPEDILKARLEAYHDAVQRTGDLLKVHATEMDRDRIIAVLHQSQAGEITRDQACQILHVRFPELLALERKFGIQAEPRWISGEEDMLHDIEAMDAEDQAFRDRGVIPTGDYVGISILRENGLAADDDAIRRWLGVGPEVPIPSEDEIERHFDRTLYGIDPDAPLTQVRVTATLGTENVKVEVEATGRRPYKKIAYPRWAGRNIGEYVDTEIKRLMQARDA